MVYAKLEVKTNTGGVAKWFKFDEPWKFGKFLLRYYKDKEYNWRELTTDEVDFCIKALNVNFKEIK